MIKTWVLYWLGLHASQVFAQAGPDPNPTGGGNQVISIQNPLTCGDVSECTQYILNGAIFLAAPLVAIMITVGGYQILFSGGQPEKVSKGWRTIIATAGGYATLLLASGVVAIIRSVLAG